MQERRDESYEEADADEYGDADVDGRVLQHVRDETHGVNGAEPGDRREKKEDESRYHFAVERKEEDGTAEDRVREVAHKKCAADNAQGTFRHGKAQAEATMNMHRKGFTMAAGLMAVMNQSGRVMWSRERISRMM